MLECSVNVAKEIPSRIDFIWSSGSLVLRTVEINVTNNSNIYVDIYHILQLGTDSYERNYKCEVVVSTLPLVVVSDNLTLNVTGKKYTIIDGMLYEYTYVCICIFHSTHSKYYNTTN